MSWRHHQPLRVSERARVTARNFPVSFELNTAKLASAGKCRKDLGDLRITVAGKEVPIQIEMVSEGTVKITFQISLASGQVREDVLLHYGNPSATMPQYDTSWGVIKPTMDGFENELLRISYGLKTSTFRKMWGCQKEFTIKRHDEDQFGGRKIPESWAKARNDVTYWEPVPPGGPKFEVEVDGPIYKRVRFFSEERIRQHHPGAKREVLRNLSQRVTFYRNCSFLREDFINNSDAVVDTAVPGGMRVRTNGKRNFEFVAYQFDPDEITWAGRGEDKETRGGFAASKTVADKDPRYRYLPEHTYNGFLMLGVVNVHNGRGIGTAVPRIRTAYFVDASHQRVGYSMRFLRGNRSAMRYLYYVEHGRREVISRGKLLAAPPTVVLPAALSPPLAEARSRWGGISIYEDSAGQKSVLLENRKIKVWYETKFHRSPETYIRQFIIKKFDESQGYWLDAAAWRAGLTDASIVRDTPEEKTVRLAWNASGKFKGPAVSKISIYPNSTILKIDYLRSAFAHICDIGTPGGRRHGAEKVIYGEKEWQEVRKKIDAPRLRNSPSPDERLTDDLYPKFPNPLIDVGWGPTPMDYKGWYIMGVCDPQTKRGYGRVVPARTMRCIKLLSGGRIPGEGFEFFPWWKMQNRSRRPYTAYLFAVTGGREEILAKGKQIADAAGEDYAPVLERRERD